MLSRRKIPKHQVLHAPTYIEIGTDGQSGSLKARVCGDQRQTSLHPKFKAIEIYVTSFLGIKTLPLTKLLVGIQEKQSPVTHDAQGASFRAPNLS